MFSLYYELTGTGWSRCTITGEVGTFTATASYLGDALGDLLDAIVSLAEGAMEARASFCEEPGKYRWVFLRVPGSDPDMVDIRILTYDDVWTGLPDDRGVEAFHVTVPVIDLCMAARAMARAVLAKHGLDGYLERWVDAPFPQTGLDRLNAWLSR